MCFLDSQESLKIGPQIQLQDTEGARQKERKKKKKDGPLFLLLKLQSSNNQAGPTGKENKVSQVLKCQELSSPILMPEAPLYLLMKGGEQTEKLGTFIDGKFFHLQETIYCRPPRGFYLEYVFTSKNC